MNLRMCLWQIWFENLYNKQKHGADIFAWKTSRSDQDICICKYVCDIYYSGS